MRSALDLLVREGLATKVRNKGVQVRQYAPEEVAEIYEIRDILQTAAIARMPLPCAAADVAALQDLCDAHLRAEAPQEIMDFNNRFHERFFGLCGNRMLAGRSRPIPAPPIRSARAGSSMRPTCGSRGRNISRSWPPCGPGTVRR